jgi:hypothetical protein
VTRPQHHFKFCPGEPEAGDLDDDAGRIAHEERIKLAKLMIEFARRSISAHPNLAHLADSALVCRLRQADLRVAALTQRVTELEALIGQRGTLAAPQQPAQNVGHGERDFIET